MRTACGSAIVGDFNPRSYSHTATNQALDHAAEALGVGVEATWVPTASLDGVAAEGALDGVAAEGVLGGYDGIWLSPGSPYRSFEGALAAVRFARERGLPFLGT
jgi:CTP synthase (UTP-ammonia lyase)